MIDLTGTWVTSFPSYVHDDPMDDSNPAPQLGAYYFTPKDWQLKLTGTFYRQAEGYFLAATILCLKFEAPGADGSGSLSGNVKLNRGGRKLIQKPDPVTGEHPISGAYSSAWNALLNIQEGTFSTIYSFPDAPDIHTEYRYVARSADELDWLWWRSFYLNADGEQLPYRANVARGTFKRVLYTGP